MVDHHKRARGVIANFSIEAHDYKHALGNNSLCAISINNMPAPPGKTQARNIHCRGEGEAYLKNDPHPKLKIDIDYRDTKGCRVFIGKNVRGICKISFRGDNSVVFIGNGAFLGRIDIVSCQQDDFVAIGSRSSFQSPVRIVSGYRSGTLSRPSIIIGDDCMFSYNVTVRSADSHPIISNVTLQQLNFGESILVEPHVWVGQGASILKGVTIGSCSIVGFGATVTKSMPRFSVCGGTPAKLIKVDNTQVWARTMDKSSINTALQWAKHYQSLKDLNT